VVPCSGSRYTGCSRTRATLEALLGAAPERSLDAALDELTDAVIAGVQIDQIDQLAGSVRQATP
jgi:hypothetical protein